MINAINLHYSLIIFVTLVFFTYLCNRIFYYVSLVRQIYGWQAILRDAARRSLRDTQSADAEYWATVSIVVTAYN